jgi:hypothetical protein
MFRSRLDSMMRDEQLGVQLLIQALKMPLKEGANACITYL